MKEIKYVLGASFGDEGKSKTVQYLCRKALDEGKNPLVVRYCSGPQASHTVIHNGITHVCSSFRSGVLLGVPTFIDNLTETYIDPIAIKVEYEVLENKGIIPELYVSSCCNIITPYDVIANRNNQESLNNGTCGCGVWETKNRQHNFTGWFSILENGTYSIEEYIVAVRDYYGYKENKELEKGFVEACKFLKQFVIINEEDLVEKYDVLIMESSQGLLLDGTRGLNPYTTPCHIGFLVSNNKVFDYESTDNFDREIYLCTRTYTTRHGAGYMPVKSDYIELPEFETNKDNPYQGVFKTGILDIDMINRAIDRHCLDNLENCKFNLVINHVDCIGSVFEYIKNAKVHITPGYNAVSTIKDNIRLKFERVIWGNSPESKFNEI